MNKLFRMIFIMLFSSSVYAHAVLDNKIAESGSYFKATIRIGHGCDGAATNKVIVEIPEGLLIAKPQPKVGWKLEIKKRKLDKPFLLHGKKIIEDVYKIIWQGGILNNEHFDEFSFVVKIGATPQDLYIPVKQECVNDKERYWHEIPEKGKKTYDYKSPAPKLTIIEGEHVLH